MKLTSSLKSHQSVWILLAITVVVMGFLPLSKTAEDAEEKKTTVFDVTCKHPGGEKSIYEFGYEEAEINSSSFIRRTGTLDSYIGYPCNVALYDKYKSQFLENALVCPFENYDEKFQKFIRDELWPTNQTNNTAADTLPWPNSLLFQYICYSKQYEFCEPNPPPPPTTPTSPPPVKGTCDGTCKCLEKVKIHAYQPGLNQRDNEPTQVQVGIHCGVQIGRICIPKWADNCKEGGGRPDYDKSLEKLYARKDFELPCQKDSGCHTEKKICECAQGHKCKSGNGAECISSQVIRMIIMISVSIFELFY